jgi:hypothetical protein
MQSPKEVDLSRARFYIKALMEKQGYSEIDFADVLAGGQE